MLAKNGGNIEPERVQRLNAALRGDGGFALESVLGEPVLSRDDLAFWNEQGYVVVKKAVSAAACPAAIDAIFSYSNMSRDKPDSWYHKNIWIPLAHHPALWENRNSPRIHTAFAQIWGRRDLWINVDVCGVNPPLRPGYAFQGTPLHWDMTLALPIRFGTQAILYLTDTRRRAGGLLLRCRLSPLAGTVAERDTCRRKFARSRAKAVAADTDRRRRRGSRDLASGAASTWI